MLGGHHVVIIVMRELCMKTVARFARGSMTDVIRDDDIVLLGIEKLALAEQNPREAFPEKLGMCSAGAMQYKDGVSYLAVFVLDRCSECYIMQLEFGERLPIVKSEILYHKVAVEDWRLLSQHSDSHANQCG